MKKYLLTISVICGFFLMGCNKDDSDSGKGSITYDCVTYQLDHATITTTKSTTILDEVTVQNFLHQLDLTSSDDKSHVKIRIGTKDAELTSGEYNSWALDISTVGRTIQSVMTLTNYVDDNLFISPSIDLVYVKKGNTYKIELKYIDSESDFSIKWEGPVKEIGLE